MSPPTPDQSYCDFDMHQQCSGYTEDEGDPESCMCACHDLEPQSAETAKQPVQRPDSLAVVTLCSLLATLPADHSDRSGVMRAIEVLRHEETP